MIISTNTHMQGAEFIHHHYYYDYTIRVNECILINVYHLCAHWCLSAVTFILCSQVTDEKQIVSAC